MENHTHNAEGLAGILYNIYRDGRSEFGYHIHQWEVLTLVEKEIWYRIADKGLNTIAGNPPETSNNIPPYDSMR